MDPGDPLPRQVLPTDDVWSTYFTSYGPVAALILLLVTLASLVSATEVAFFTLSADDRSSCRESAAPADRRIAMLLDRPRRLLASLVIFNNLLNIAIVVMATYLTWELSQLAHASAVVLSGITFVLTLVIVLFGEIIPKVFASENSLAVARRTTPLARMALLAFRPLSSMLVNLSTQIDKRLPKQGYKLSVEELNQAVEMTGSETTVEEREILKGIVNFSNLTARQVMRSRMDITAFEDDLTFSELMSRINASGYSRVPVFKETIDQIDGILYLKDLLPHLHSDDSFAWQTLLRPAFFIPETKKVDDLMQDFQRRRVHMAIVVDEYGGTRGLVTLEDIIEEIFGDINDEFDDDTPAGFRRIDDHTVVVEGKLPLTDVCRVLDVDATTFDDVRGDSESLGGLLLELFSRLPQPGEEVQYGQFHFHVLSADNKRINEVRITEMPLSLS
ncbi:gliding motility-associated protein GldE [Rudanella paleaurantiibacter]|uniref:Gliding motility-associated protein GldE n=1 Tax=Rudanella paleaurantiibacter TaxID=2614655 RepID=A0A7J5TWB8_9BACT|nr:gliding motility-associated protein GldE [Rudanella paleaurantiibacter]KAB7728751.1 gliding motility-associated protein GldE [Rudanella paleaurantiibacter]